MRFWKLLPLLATSLCFAAQSDRVAGTIDANQMVRLSGHLHRKALPQYDQGRLPSSSPISQVMLLTLPTASQQQALRRLVAEQQDPRSPNFHKWITPQQYADRFGLSQNDVQKITAWLKSQGLHVDNVANGRNWIVFSGTTAQVESAFRTELHRYNVDGETHFANSIMPSVPASIAGITTGIRGLDDFRPKSSATKKSVAAAQKARPDYYSSNFNAQFVAPGDIETIYDLTPLYNANPKIDGTGQKLVIAGQTDVYLADLNNFRSGFGLPAISGCTTDANGVITSCATSTTSNFQYVLVNGVDPGVSPNGDVTEADLDLEWSAATAPGAQIIYVNSGNVFNSYYDAIDNNRAPVISLSYGAPCEFDDNFVSADETELTKANSFGITFVNSSGDSGSASCDGPTNSSTANLAVGGLAVSYPASSPEVTAVGGTAIDFTTGFSSTYWTTSNGTNGGTAQNPPLPETSWNDDVELGIAFPGSFGNPQSVQQTFAIVQSGGGASNCSVQTSNNLSCVSGFPKPSWQTVTIPGVTSPTRFVPDVSLLGSPNFPGYIFCTPLDQWISSTSTASSCAPGGTGGITAALALTDPGNSNQPSPTIVGGTSASAPVFAGIVVLLNQYLGGNGLGNINPMLYSLAKTPANGAFHPVTTGDNIVYCEGATPSGFPAAYLCPGAVGTTGTIGFQASNADTVTGYNLVTGLGSIDADALALAWAAARPATTTAVTTPSSSVNQGTSVTFTATVAPSTATGTVSFFNNGSTTALATSTLSGGTATYTTTTLPVGTDSVTASYNGDGYNNVSTSVSPAVVTVIAPYSMSASPMSLTVPAGQTATHTITVTPTAGFTGTVNFGTPAGCTAGVPAGALCTFTNPNNPSNPTTVTLDGNPAHPMAITLTISTAANMTLPSGAQAITVSGTSGTTTVNTTVNLTVNATNQSFMLTTTAATFPVAVGATAMVNVTVANPSGGGGTPLPFVGATTALPLTYTCSSTPPLSTLEISCQISPGNGQPTNVTAVTISLVTTPKTAQLTPFGGRRIFYAMLLPGLFGIVFAAGSRTRGARLLCLIVVLGFSTLWMGACGGSSNNVQKNPGTPPGMYPVTINATTGGANPLTFSLPITLNVQ
jgi:subtilase family serine protease